jgi:hypothetical protein
VVSLAKSELRAIIKNALEVALLLRESKMMSTVKALLLVAGLSGAAVSVAAADGFLGDADLAATFTGMTLDGVYQDGGFFSETYAPDGTIRYVDANGRSEGSWAVKDGAFCTFYKSQEGSCFFVRREGTNCFAFFEPKAGPGGSKVPREDWTSRGWNRASPSTCVESRQGTI